MLPGSLHVGLPAGSLHVGQHLSVKDAALPWLQNGALAKMDILKCQGPGLKTNRVRDSGSSHCERYKCSSCYRQTCGYINT